MEGTKIQTDTRGFRVLGLGRDGNEIIYIRSEDEGFRSLGFRSLGSRGLRLRV